MRSSSVPWIGPNSEKDQKDEARACDGEGDTSAPQNPSNSGADNHDKEEERAKKVAAPAQHSLLGGAHLLELSPLLAFLLGHAEDSLRTPWMGVLVRLELSGWREWPLVVPCRLNHPLSGGYIALTGPFKEGVSGLLLRVRVLSGRRLILGG